MKDKKLYLNMPVSDILYAIDKRNITNVWFGCENTYYINRGNVTRGIIDCPRHNVPETPPVIELSQ